MAPVGEAELVNQRYIADDVVVAARCGSTTLITALTASDVEHLARLIHAASVRATSPFVQVAAGALPVEAELLVKTFASLIDMADGGTVLLMEVAEMPRVVQEGLMEMLAQLQVTRNPGDRVRLIAGTTADLRDCIAAGLFSEQLFYRLNVVHVVVGIPQTETAPLQATARQHAITA